MQGNEGGCLCRAIRYRVSAAPEFSVICHCLSCRKASGAPSVAWLTFKRADFEFLSGDPRSFKSSPGVIRRFCDRCGSALTYEIADRAGTIDVTTVSLDDPNVFPPNAEVWLEHRIPWEATQQALAQYARGGSEQ